MASKIYVPTTTPDDWRHLLSRDYHWKTGSSAKTLARCWEDANGFPKSVCRAFLASKIALLGRAKLLMAMPEYKVSVAGCGAIPQNDVFAIAIGCGETIAITVEGKVDEPFGVRCQNGSGIRRKANKRG